MKKSYNLKNFLLILVSLQIIIISLIIVSAVCCEREKNDGFCVDTTANNCDLSNGYISHPNNCTKTDFCKPGYCYDSKGTCLPGSLKASCLVNPGAKWYETDIDKKCTYGCCWLGPINTQPLMMADCQKKSQDLGLPFNFTTPVGDCHFYTEAEGACMLSNNKCVFTTDENCLKTLHGEFREGLLCTNPSLNTGYTKLAYIGCDPTGNRPEIFWFDSANNRENIYGGNTPGAKNESWNSGNVKKKENSCGASDPNGNAGLTTCGNCKEGVSECSATTSSENHVIAGNYVCKNLGCEDSYFKKLYMRNPRNGESWCVYDAYVGDGKDVVGSTHWRRYCEDGKVKYEPCGGDYREKICAEKIVDQTHKAQCRYNLGGLCFGVESKDECLKYDDCKWQVVDIADQFNFSVCVPKYPKGFNFDSGNPDENGKNVCRLATMTCMVSLRRDTNTNSHWSCTHNCDCNSKEFVEKMNDFCISLGDCGSYINYIGNGTDNYAVTDAVTASDLGMEVSWKNYSGYLPKLNNNRLGGNTPWWINIVENPGVWSSIIKIKTEGDFWGGEGGATEIKLPIQNSHNIKSLLLTFTCLPWQPPAGGDYCDLCNKDPLRPCSEYRCRSLGTACSLMKNVYAQENPICYNNLSKERNPPIISFNKIQSSYKFAGNNDAVRITPSGGGCTYNFSILNFFSIKTDEAAECRWSLTPTEFEEMDGYFEELNQFAITHNYNTTGGINIHDSDGLFQIYIKCMDRLGNINSNSFVMSFCLSSAPDINAPDILRTNPVDGSHLKKDVPNSSLIIYLNEPSQCKYDLLKDVPYENMSNNMSCNNDSAAQSYLCGTFLTDLNSPVNTIYIKCNDSVGNFMTYDYTYTLLSTEEDLVVTIDSPQDGTTREEKVGKENPLYIKATTQGGAGEGNANCKWKYNTSEGFPVGGGYFAKTGGTTHEDSFNNLDNDTYVLQVSCEDSAGNKAEANSKFSVKIDDEGPKIANKTKEGSNLKLTTDELAKCYYTNDNTQDCVFDLVEGNGVHKINSGDSFAIDYIITGFSEMENYYIRCVDEHGNVNIGCADIIGATITNDYKAPVVTRIYYDKDLDKLIVKTNKPARCYYTNNGCSFTTENGVHMDSGLSTVHEAVWTDIIYYRIRCIDTWKNEGCVIEAKASEIK